MGVALIATASLLLAVGVFILGGAGVARWRSKQGQLLTEQARRDGAAYYLARDPRFAQNVRRRKRRESGTETFWTKLLD